MGRGRKGFLISLHLALEFQVCPLSQDPIINDSLPEELVREGRVQDVELSQEIISLHHVCREQIRVPDRELPELSRASKKCQHRRRDIDGAD